MMTVQVEGVGAFEIQRRTMRVQVAISAEYNRLTEGAAQVSPALDGLASFLSYLAVMVVKAPDDWDVYAIDPDDPEAIERAQKVYRALVDAEARFREGAGEDAQKSGTRAR